MTKFDKLLNEILQLSNDLRFEELSKVLQAYGYSLNNPRGGSSHYVFRKKGSVPITIPKHNPIKKIYVQMVKEVIEEVDKNDKNQ